MMRKEVPYDIGSHTSKQSRVHLGMKLEPSKGSQAPGLDLSGGKEKKFVYFDPEELEKEEEEREMLEEVRSSRKTKIDLPM